MTPVTTTSNGYTTTTTLYVVQRCWYSGPNVQPPVDYLRLLPTLQQAEQVAYASAHWFASTTATSRNSNNSSSNGVVRTIQLPKPSGGADSASPSMYGFLAEGQLFWIRPVLAYATAVAESYGEAHCIVTQGILGGGPAPPRPGQHVGVPAPETCPPRIFVGPQSSHAALQLIASSTSSFFANRGGPPHSSAATIPLGSTVQWVPVGSPPSLDQLAQEWPQQQQPSTTSSMSQPQHTGDSIMTDDSTSSSSSSASKRVGSYNAENEWFRNTNYHRNSDNTTALLWGGGDSKEHRMEQQQQQRPAKRACRPVPENHYGATTTSASHGPWLLSSSMED